MSRQVSCSHPGCSCRELEASNVVWVETAPHNPLDFPTRAEALALAWAEPERDFGLGYGHIDELTKEFEDIFQAGLIWGTAIVAMGEAIRQRCTCPPEVTDESGMTIPLSWSEVCERCKGYP